MKMTNSITAALPLLMGGPIVQFGSGDLRRYRRKQIKIAKENNRSRRGVNHRRKPIAEKAKFTREQRINAAKNLARKQKLEKGAM